jgi:hypothetical protein
LVEGVISTVLSVESLAFPIVCGVFTATYTLAKNKEAVCADTGTSAASTTAHVCTEEELAALAAGFKISFITLLIVGIIVLGAAIILGIFAHKICAIEAGNVGKAKAGNVTGMIGLILGAVVLVLTIVLAIVGIAAL